jgi:hypothetical protein
MPRPCSICAHPERAAIEKALVAGTSSRQCAALYRVSPDAVERHKAAHLPVRLVSAQEAQEEADALDVMATLRHCLARVTKVYDACDRWLEDPANPGTYTLEPRAEEVQVVYLAAGADGKPERRKAPLSTLLARLGEAGVPAASWEVKHADPRDLILRTDRRLQGQLELIAKLLGDLDERPQLNVFLASPEWQALRGRLYEVLRPYPEVRAAVAEVFDAASA